MKVFISWSGDRSEALARALHEWLPLALHFVEPWLSQSDIQAGERWSLRIAKGLEDCNFGIMCITRNNLNAPWILFEAGALAKSMEDGRVIPLLLDVEFKEITGPLAQFQAKKVDQAGVRELVTSLNKSASTPIAEQQLDRLFAALWSDLESQISGIAKESQPAKHARPQGEVLEELVSNVRRLEMRFRDVLDEDPVLRGKRRRRVQPWILRYVASGSTDGVRDPIQLIVIASTLRDEAPWVYELALEAYRAIRSGSQSEIELSMRRFLEAADVLVRTPLGAELGIDRGLLQHVLDQWSSWLMSAPADHAPDRTRRHVVRADPED
mgnify:CR=1 FL=1